MLQCKKGSKISLVNNTYCIALFRELQCMLSHLRPQEVLQGEKITLINPKFPKLNLNLTSQIVTY